MRLVPGEITYLLQLISEDITADENAGTPRDQTVGRREIFAKLEQMRDEWRKAEKITTAPVESELAGMFLEEAIREGREIEIPSLGIKLNKGEREV